MFFHNNLVELGSAFCIQSSQSFNSTVAYNLYYGLILFVKHNLHILKNLIGQFQALNYLVALHLESLNPQLSTRCYDLSDLDDALLDSGPNSALAALGMLQPYLQFLNAL